MTNTNYISIHNLNVTEHTADESHNITVFADALTYKGYMTSLINSYFYQIATVSDTDGLSYVINMLNVKSISENAYDTIEIEFINSEILYIRFNSTVRAVYEKKYLKFIYECNHFEEIYKNVRRLKVSPEFTTDNESLVYETIQEANDNSSNGDLIYIHSGEYSEKVVTLNGRIYYFEEGANVTSSLASVLDNERETPYFGYEEAVTLKHIKVFGRGKFNSTAGEFDAVITTTNDLNGLSEDNTLTIYVECERLFHSAGRVVLIGETILKCKYISNESLSYAVWDTDFASEFSGINIIDATLIQSYQSEFTFHQDLDYSNYIIKNANILCDSASGLINVGSMSSDIKQTFELCMLFNLDISGGGIVGMTSDYNVNIDLYNCVLQQEAGTYSNTSLGAGMTYYNLYSYNYFTKTYNSNTAVITDYNSSTNYKLIT